MTHLDLSTIPSFCAHEHWGSVAAFGTFPGGFTPDITRGALPSRRVGLMDLVLDPYFSGNLASNGQNMQQLAEALQQPDLMAVPNSDIPQVWRNLEKLVRNQLLTGTFSALRYGLLALYGTDVLDASDSAITELDNAIAVNYADPFAWYQRAMSTSRFTHLIRPVHPEFYYTDDTTPAAHHEDAFTRTVMRIDPLLSFWTPESRRRSALTEATGIEPVDAATWRAFLAALFDQAASHGAVGIKQLQAYSRPLAFSLPEDSSVQFRGNLDAAGVRRFEDWVVHACSAQAHERGWPQQVHVGTHNIGESSPLPLMALARRYPRMPIVQLHCWPFLSEAGWLAKQVPSIYIDTCWLPILNPEYYRQALRSWVNYVPANKICCSHDATSVEMAAGSARLVRQIAGQVLTEQQANLDLDNTLVTSIAGGWLNDNAVRLYDTGEKE